MKAAPHEDVAALLTRFAQGDQEAQDSMVDYALQGVRDGRVTVEHGIGVAELCARVAAARGDVRARTVLAGVLFYVAQVAQDIAQASEASADLADNEVAARVWRDAAAYRVETRDAHIAEAVAIMDDLANEGDEAAAEFVNRAADWLPPEALDAARLFSRFWRDSEPGACTTHEGDL